MILRDDQLVGIPVETEDGMRMGRLTGFVLDSESGVVAQYRVRPPGIAALLMSDAREFLVHHTQVVSISTQRMVVRSAGDTEWAHRREKRMLVPAEQTQPAVGYQPSTIEKRERK